MKKLSIIIPVYNEEKLIRKTIFAVCQAKIVGLKKEIIVVDDGSTDGTPKELKRSKTRVRVRGIIIKTVRLKTNKGKGAAVRAGLKRATGQIVVIQDADLEYNPAEIGRLILPIRSGFADVVYGSRFTGGQARRVLFIWHMIANKLLTFVSNIFTNLNLTDMETGYKAFKTSLIKKLKLKENRFGFEPEVTAKMAKLNCRVYEVGISYRGRRYEEGKKIRWYDGLLALWYILKYSF